MMDKLLERLDQISHEIDQLNHEKEILIDELLELQAKQRQSEDIAWRQMKI